MRGKIIFQKGTVGRIFADGEVEEQWFCRREWENGDVERGWLARRIWWDKGGTKNVEHWFEFEKLVEMG